MEEHKILIIKVTIVAKSHGVLGLVLKAISRALHLYKVESAEFNYIEHKVEEIKDGTNTNE